MIRAARRDTTRQQLAGLAVTAAALILTAAGAADPAVADNHYPSWQDVQNARASESEKQAQIHELQAFIVALTAEARTAETIATQRGSEYEIAQARFDEATYDANTLATQAADADARAAASGQVAGQVAAALARAGASDLTVSMLMDAGTADDLLARLASLDKFTEQVSRIYRAAEVDRNTAEALTEQARLAESIRGQLAEEAEEALAAAIAARDAANRKLVEQQANEATMQAQLAVLSENREATEADYEKGEAARRAAEAARLAAIAAQGGGNGGLDSGQLSDQGWALPVSGWISDRFGPRPNRPVAGVGAFHYGTDIAAGCGQPVYAATGGTVVYADWLGSYGLWVLIDHGNGVQTGYAHNGSLRVSPGQWVPAGANIAEVGNTGASTGCHLHYEVRVDGARIDPEPFMSNRGITLG